MNIFGEGLPKEILDQVKYRQKVYGSGFQRDDGTGNTLRLDDQIVYLNSKTAWCKLISGVDIDNISELNNPTIQSLNIIGSELAKKFVLFNGTFDTTNGEQKAGINPTKDILGYNYAYGIGGTDFGIRPMMGIQGASIRHENRGSLRRAEVKIKAFNRAQLEIIDALYLRLGYSVLLEWGHSMLIDSSGNIDTNPVNLSLADEFLSGNLTCDEFLQLIYEQRLATGGNYDAMLAKINNFQWSLNSDGSYDITVKLISIGDLIESLKINTLTDSSGVNTSSSPIQYSGLTKTDESAFEDDIAGDIIDAFSYSSTIGNFLYLTKTLADKKGIQNASKDLYTLSLNPSDITLYNELNSIVNDRNNKLLQFNLNEFDQDMDDVMAITFDDLGGKWVADDLRYYTRLGTFLKFLNSYIIPFLYNNKNTASSALNIDYDENTNLMNVNILQVSVDPRICYVNRTIPIESLGVTYNYVFGAQNPKNPFINSTITNAINKKYVYYGNIMNIYLENTFILKTIENLKDDKGNLSLIDFLQGLMKGLNESLGGINDFDVFLDETNNTIKIIDKNPLSDLEQVITAVNTNYPSAASIWNNNRPLNQIQQETIFELYGYWPQFTSRGSFDPNNNTVTIIKNSSPLAGFIKEFELKSEIPPDFSTMITAGAAAKGSVVGENDTALSKLNRGLSDRYKISITNDINLNPPSSLDDYNSKKEAHRRMLYDYIEFMKKLSHSTDVNSRIPVADDKDIDTFKGVLPSLIQKAISVDKAYDLINQTTTHEDYQGTGFIPFNLSLTMDGLSGMKINQQFNMDISYLPSNYPSTMRFLIKRLSHEIKNNRWETKLETYCIPKATPNNISLRPAIEGGTDTETTTENTPPNPTPSSQLYKGQNKSTYLDTVQFLTWVLHGIGIPNPNQSQIQFMKVWRQAEAGKAAWNPLNTTLKKSGSKPYNRNIDPNTGIDYPVQNYATRSDGLNATVASLKSSRYTNVVNGIKNIRTDSDINNVTKLVNNSSWGTRFASNYTTYVPLTNFIYTDPIIPK